MVRLSVRLAGTRRPCRDRASSACLAWLLAGDDVWACRHPALCRAPAAARVLARMLGDPLAEYVRLAVRYGDAVRVPFAPHKAVFLLSRPEHAEHVLAANQDNYVKAFTYRPLRALVGNGLLTSEGEAWRRHRRLIQPVFSRRDVACFGPQMTAAARRLVRRWEALPAGSLVDVAREMNALALEIAGLALFGADLTGDAGQIARAMSTGQRVTLAAALLPIRWGPRSTRAVKAAARRIGRTPEGIDGPAGRLVAAITHAGTKEGVQKLYDQAQVTADDVAEIIAFVLSRPRRLAINEVLLRPAGQQ